MELDDTTWYLVKNTIGVTGFVSSGNKPVPLQEDEVANILESLGDGTRKAKPTWAKGDVVRVTADPFTDFTGTIEEVNADKQKIKVLISIFGRDTPVELDFNQIERV
jgi:transcriptional antiterminator NusG